MLKALDAGRIRPFDRAAADPSPQSSLCTWLQLRLMVEAAYWLINYVLSLRDYFYMFEFESSSTAILRVTPRLTTHSFVTAHQTQKEGTGKKQSYKHSRVTTNRSLHTASHAG